MSGVHTLALTGELTISTATERRPEFAAALEAAEQAGATVLELDLSEITELDTAGVQLLLATQREGSHLGRTVRLAAMSQAVADVLSIAHLTADLDPGRASVAAPTGGAEKPDAEETTP